MKIQIFIRGGCLSEVRATSKDVEVELIDYDNLEDEETLMQDALPYEIDFDPA
jgi:hypothetical protein